MKVDGKYRVYHDVGNTQIMALDSTHEERWRALDRCRKLWDGGNFLSVTVTHGDPGEPIHQITASYGEGNCILSRDCAAIDLNDLFDPTSDKTRETDHEAG